MPRLVQRAKSKLVLEHVVVRKLKGGAGGSRGGDGGGEQLDQAELQDLIKFGAAELFADDDAGGQAGGNAGLCRGAMCHVPRT